MLIAKERTFFMKHVQLKHSLLLLLTAAIWGFAFVAQSVGMDYVKPFTFNGVRSAIGALFLVPCIFLFQKHSNSTTSFVQELGNASATKLNSPAHETSPSAQTVRNKKNLLLGGICCGIVLAAASSLQQIGISYTTVGKAGFLTAIYIVLVPILGLFLKKKCSPFVWISVGLALVGLYLLSVTDGFDSIGKGDLLLIVSSFLFAVHILVVDYFSPRCNGVALSCIQFFVCAIVCLIPALLFEHPSFSSILDAWAPILYAGVFSCGVGYTLQIIGQKGMNPTIASLILSLESTISVLAGWLLLGQTLSARELAGCGIVFVAIILAQLPWPNYLANPTR